MQTALEFPTCEKCLYRLTFIQFCSVGRCAPLQHNKIKIQRTLQRVFNTTSIWLAFDQAFENNKTCWNKKKYSEEWSSNLVKQTLQKTISGGKDQLKTTPTEHQKNKTRSHDNPTILLQYSGNPTQNFASKLKKLCNTQVVFITRKLRSCLKSQVVYKRKCNVCGSIYAGQTSRHFTTR